MRVLHCLCQRPSLTGSGVTLEAVVRHAADAGWDQRVVVGVPREDPQPEVGGLSDERVHPLAFGGHDLPFAVPGMSDVMPYESTVFSTMSDDMVGSYEAAWKAHISKIIHDFKPDIIHSHHIWLMSAILKDLAPEIPVVTHCHATGLRQMKLVPRLADVVRAGCVRNEGFTVLHREHARVLANDLAVAEDRIHVVGAGYRSDLFHGKGRNPNQRPALLYIGKYSAAKGLPSLLDAFDRLSRKRPELNLHIAGDGAGEEAEALRKRMLTMAPRVVLHGQIPQTDLAELMRRATVVVLPSFYEGLPLVLVEALACGCRLVATDLPGVVEELAPRLDTALELIELPAMAGIDTPVEAELPGFVDRLESGLAVALDAPRPGDQTEALKSFTWEAVFQRVEDVWRKMMH